MQEVYKVRKGYQEEVWHGSDDKEVAPEKLAHARQCQHKSLIPCLGLAVATVMHDHRYIPALHLPQYLCLILYMLLILKLCEAR